eukprot:9496710-Lingulodinium_polyedra.AAC.1
MSVREGVSGGNPQHHHVVNVKIDRDTAHEGLQACTASQGVEERKCLRLVVVGCTEPERDPGAAHDRTSAEADDLERGASRVRQLGQRDVGPAGAPCRLRA